MDDFHDYKLIQQDMISNLWKKCLPAKKKKNHTKYIFKKYKQIY